MKKAIVFSLIIIPLFSFSQFSVGLQLGMNYPISYTKEEIVRQLGSELGVQLALGFNNDLGIETGLGIETFGRLHTDAYAMTDASFLVFQLYLPLLATYKFYDDRIILRTGIMVGAKNLLFIQKYNESTSLNHEAEDFVPSLRHIAFDFNLGFIYQFNERLGVLLNYRTPLNYSIFRYVIKKEYGIFSCGLNYKIVNH